MSAEEPPSLLEMSPKMHRFPHSVFVAAGLRTPFGRGGGALANYDAVG